VRLFVAVGIDPAVARRIAAFSADLRRVVEQLAPAARINWVDESQLHITSRFIGHANDAQQASILAALRTPLTQASFSVRASGAGVFPPRRAPRVIWAGIREGLESLSEVEREVTDRLASCGIAPGDRPYSPHITLARVKEPAGLRAAIFEERAPPDFGSWRVETITLFESRHSARGQQYVPIQSTRLRSPVDPGGPG
jgi:2'-5' RNA ligase